MIAPFVMFLTLTVQDSAPRRVESVPAVDLPRYAGLWYEVARFPNRFQARCRGETTATYEPLPNGELRVGQSDLAVHRLEHHAQRGQLGHQLRRERQRRQLALQVLGPAGRHAQALAPGDGCRARR